MECAAGGGCGVWDPTVRAGRAQHAATGGRHEPLWARNLRGDQCAGGWTEPLVEAGQGRVYREVGAAGGAGGGRPEEEDCWAGDGGARDRPGRVLRAFTCWRSDWPGYVRLAGAFS